MAAVAPGASSRRHFAELLAEARARTILLVSPLSSEDTEVQPDDAVEPVLRELDRIVRFEKRWLVEDSSSTQSASYDEWFDHMTEVRQRALDRLEAVDEFVGPLSLEHRFRLVLEHEYRRGEAILETAQLLGEVYRAPRRTILPRGRRLADPGAMARFPGGMVEIGAARETLTWPEEQPAQRIELKPFWVDVTPVTNGDFLTFMAAGGYMTAELWSEDGWRWVREYAVRMPRHWVWEDGAWWSRWMDRTIPLDLSGPVGIVSYYEAEAFARFVGKRLPTELEWEAAAAWDPETQSRRAYPWGNMPPSPNVANLDQLAFEPASVGAFPGNVSPVGCYGLVGDLWEWTASDFILNRGTSDSGLKVLRGGCWATRPGAIRTTTRRPVLPSARHVFSGFRCAHDA